MLIVSPIIIGKTTSRWLVEFGNMEEKTMNTNTNIIRKTLDNLFSKMGYGRIEEFEIVIEGYKREIEKLTKQNEKLTSKKNKYRNSRGYFKRTTKNTREDIKVSEELLNEEGERQMRLTNTISVVVSKTTTSNHQCPYMNNNLKMVG